MPNPLGSISVMLLPLNRDETINLRMHLLEEAHTYYRHINYLRYTMGLPATSAEVRKYADMAEEADSIALLVPFRGI